MSSKRALSLLLQPHSARRCALGLREMDELRSVANQRPKVTLISILRRRLWYRFRSEEQLKSAPRWAQQLSVARTPIAAKVLAGLSNQISGEVLPEEVKGRYLAKALEAPLAAGDNRTAKQRAFYCIETAAELHALLRYAVAEAEDGRSEFAAEPTDTAEVDHLAQQIWRWFSDDGDGGGWAESVAEDHDHSEGGSGNHVRSVIRNELRQLETRLVARTGTDVRSIERELFAASEARVQKQVGEMLAASEARIAAMLEKGR